MINIVLLCIAKYLEKNTALTSLHNIDMAERTDSKFIKRYLLNSVKVKIYN